MKNQGIIGAVIMAIGGMCPLIHVPILGNWNYFDVDLTLATVFYVLVLMGLTAAFMQRPGLVRLTGWAGIGLVIITLIGIYFKSHDYFSFIHFKKLINLGAGMVKYKWGWLLILLGTLILVTVRKREVALVPSALPTDFAD